MIFVGDKSAMRIWVTLLLLFALLSPIAVAAKIGVGVSTGKIRVDEPLKAGGVYDLPPLMVINTGDQPFNYGVGVEYQANQPEIRPDPEWFTFSPEVFQLDPGKVQRVNIQVTLPIKTQPGDYFAYLEGRPLYSEQEGGVTRIGIAAAAKLNFSVAPANIFQAIYYRVLHFWNAWSPWTYIAIALLAGSLVLVLARRFFSFNVGLRKRDVSDFATASEEEEEVVIIRRPKKKPTKVGSKSFEEKASGGKRNK